MKPRLAAVLMLLALLPLGAFCWLGARASRNEEEVVRHAFQEVLRGKLKDIDDDISGLIKERERALTTLIDAPIFSALPPPPGKLGASANEAIREMIRRNALISAIFVLQSDGRLIHPALDGDLIAAEREFLRRGRHAIVSGDLLHQAALNNDGGGSQASTAQGWYTWYWDNGINLIFWRRMASGHIVGVELDRSRMLADIIARLPNTVPGDAALSGGGIELLGSDGVPLYQWGEFRHAEKESARAELAVAQPLSSWHLNYFLPTAELDSALKSGRRFSFYGTFAAMGLVLLGLAFYFYRELSRQMREAAQRVNFVNRVSHELKTPLTNIRLYAELLEERLPGDPSPPAPLPQGERGDQLALIPQAERAADALNDSTARRYLNVIVTESQRLSRLIGNVLLFGRRRKQPYVLHPSAGVIDDCVAATLEQFRPAFEFKGIEIRHVRGAQAAAHFDSDAVGQILGNLFSNVEKYAASGRWMEVATSQRDGVTEILVSDKGSGIPAKHRAKIFEPFYRISNALSDGVAGTGIGLTIARDLARLHGGELFVVPPSGGTLGAHFKLTLKTPAPKGETCDEETRGHGDAEARRLEAAAGD